MKTAAYSLLTMRPDPERVDVLCVGVAVRADQQWHISVLSTAEKLHALDADYPLERLTPIAANLKALLTDCQSLADARRFLSENGSAVALHDFEGRFAYSSDTELRAQVDSIMKESVLPVAAQDTESYAAVSPRRSRIRARLSKQFKTMGIFGSSQAEIASHKVIRDFPVSAKHGLVAEFALKNSAMHFTETVDFAVIGLREKTFEAQAKCLVMRTARETFGSETQCHFVVAGSNSGKASRTVDLLSTAGKLWAVESALDMAAYFDAMAKAAQTTGQLGAP